MLDKLAKKNVIHANKAANIQGFIFFIPVSII